MSGEETNNKSSVYLPVVDTLISSETRAQRELAAKYIQCVEDLLEGCRENCHLSESVLNQTAAVRYDNIVTYEKKLTFRMFQLLAADLRELVELLGRNALKYSEHKKLGQQVCEKFEGLEPGYFGSKAFIEKTDHIQRTFREVWMKETKQADSAKEKTQNPKDATSPQKNASSKTQSPQKGANDTGKKQLLKHGAGYESARKTDKDILNLRESSKDLSGSRTVGVEAQIPQRKKKTANTTITVVSKHNPKADVTDAFRWRPEESLLQTKLNKEKARLDEEYRQVEERIRKREEEERKIREEEARKQGKLRAGSKGRRPRDEYLTTSSEIGGKDSKLDDSLSMEKSKSGDKGISKDGGFQHIPEDQNDGIKIEGTNYKSVKSSATAIPASMNKELEAEEIQESSHENFKSLEFDLKFRRRV